ncbi:MAG: transcription elongation factor GreA [Clostridia bacterium]|nr:transcription elongation factor GreA [Clostridia bacterium]MBR2875477.1 transcription elongation factor GreA [Clostridia bacterium]
MSNKVILTQEGYDELQKQLDYLRAVKRHEVAQRIKIAREFGDLSENAEYDAAKEEQRQVESKIFSIEQQLKNCEIQEATAKNIVALDKFVTVSTNGVEARYRIVDITKADVSKGYISNVSPVGAALMGKKVGNVVVVKTPRGEKEFKVLKIEDKE